ncbi:REP element-mobilizing transposase RayT [Flavobacterium aquidurense]|uniref:Transposase n=1 Tax=Flavobacterium frigidimaris TaxID=262320 RepID=A0ABX4BKL8_FLAFR|nr:transposase [Flavobacterium frigidimaris]OXA75865.1 transposase [Flavobacterium frigidimaris]SDZ67172.1 REP element-mobilizing transposase RayT [Flavobacterium aquidurense]
MKAGYVIRDQRLPNFITPAVVDWIDIFTRQTYRDIVIECLDYCIKNKGMILYGYVIMSNHIHLIIQSENGKLSDLIRDFKKFIARNILDRIQNSSENRREWMLERFKLAAEKYQRNKEYQFWQYGNHAEEIYSTAFMWSKLHYIHLNPVRAGLVAKASEYIYSSAGNYVNDSGMLEIEKVDNPIVNVVDPRSITLYNLY